MVRKFAALIFLMFLASGSWAVDSFLELMFDIDLDVAEQQRQDEYYQRALFLRHQTKPEHLDSAGLNQLHWAVLCNQIIQIPGLLKNKNIINIPTKRAGNIRLFNITPLMLATLYKRFEIFEILLKNGADPTIGTKKFYSFMGMALAHDKECEGPIEHATRKNYIIITNLLSDHDKNNIIYKPEKSCCSIF